MPDPAPNNDPAPDPANPGNDPAPNTDPAPAPDPKGNEPDPTQMSDEQINQALEGPDLWKKPRLKKLLDDQKELRELKAADQKRQDEDLKKQNKHKELADKNGKERDELKAKLETSEINQKLTNKLVAIGGVVDIEGALALIGRKDLQLNDDGTVEGIDAAIEALKTAKPYLFGKSDGTQSLGGPSNPQNPGQNSGPAKFKRSQLKDPQFYKDNQKAILAAAAAGQIEDDITPSPAK